MKRLFFLLAVCASLPVFAQQNAGTPVTIRDFLKMSSSDTTLCVVKGVVSSIRSSSAGNLYIKDGTGELFIYGIVDPAHPNRGFRQYDIRVGDTLSLSGRRQVYKETIEMTSARLISKSDGPDHNVPVRFDKEPSFRGKSGPDALAAFGEWVSGHLRYPEGAGGEEGTVFVRFVVGRNGGVQEVQVEKGLGKALNDEAVRVVSASPKWKPAEMGGSKVRATLFVPVRFARP